MSTIDEDNNDISICANCGKEGTSDEINNICNKCKQVKYCNAACKKKHRSKHKKACERRVAELHEEALFKEPPPPEECPICFQRRPYLNTGWRYQPCCGKVICSGCLHAPVYDNQGNEVAEEKCAFCRTPTPKSSGEAVERLKKRVAADDAKAIHITGCCHFKGLNGYPQDVDQALELWHRSGELGRTDAYATIGLAYENGDGVERDKKKATYYYELAAMKGDADARCNLGNDEAKAGNIDRALKHYMIAATWGHDGALEMIKELYSNGHATKDNYTKALQSYQEYSGEIKSVQRDKAAAFSEKYRYY